MRIQTVDFSLSNTLPHWSFECSRVRLPTWGHPIPLLYDNALGEEGDLAVVGDLGSGSATAIVDFCLQDLEEFLSTFGMSLDQVILLGLVLGKVEKLHGW